MFERVFNRLGHGSVVEKIEEEEEEEEAESAEGQRIVVVVVFLLLLLLLLFFLKIRNREICLENGGRQGSGEDRN